MAKPNVDDLVKSIAEETNTPTDVVSKLYAETWAQFSEGAQIMDYLTVLTVRRVRENLRNGRPGSH
jgi:hypothetical protein